MQSAFDNRRKRSSTNLQHLSLAPLTPKFPIGGGNELPDDEQNMTRLSYIEFRSIPSTPSILASNPFSSHVDDSQRSKSHPDFHTPPLPFESTGKVDRPLDANRLRKSRTAIPQTRHNDRREWFLRAGAAISSETREWKGQSWLVNRASSTSLTGLSDGDDSSESPMLPPLNTSIAAPRSRYASRAASARASRRGSRVELLTPSGIKTPGQDSPPGRIQSGYFTAPSSAVGRGYDPLFQGPQFVNPLDAEEAQSVAQDELGRELEAAAEAQAQAEEDAELSRLTRERGFGLGRLVDGFLGFPLFAVNEDEIEDFGVREEHNADRKDVQGEIPHTENVQATGVDAEVADTEDVSAWRDASYLMSIAARSFFV